MKNKLMSRKFWLVLVILIGTTALLLLNKIESGQWVTVIISIISVYIGGNVIQNVGYNWSRSNYNRNGEDTTKDGAEL